MSMEISTGICYGTIISEEEAEKLLNHIEENLGAIKADCFRDEYCRCIDQWSGGSCFLGFVDILSSAPYMIFESDISKHTPDDIEKVLEIYGLEEVIDIYDYDPQCYVIQFFY